MLNSALCLVRKCYWIDLCTQITMDIEGEEGKVSVVNSVDPLLYIYNKRNFTMVGKNMGYSLGEIGR